MTKKAEKIKEKIEKRIADAQQHERIFESEGKKPIQTAEQERKAARSMIVNMYDFDLISLSDCQCLVEFIDRR